MSTIEPVNVTFPPLPVGVSYSIDDVVPEFYLQGWYDFEATFMAGVQPVSLDINFTMEMVNNLRSQGSAYLSEYLAKPQVLGLLLLLAMGLAYVVLMIFSGLVFCCYRCCCRRNIQRFDKTGATKSRARMNIALVAFSLLFIFGTIMVFGSSAELLKSIQRSELVIDSAFCDLETLMNNTDDQVSALVLEGFNATRSYMEDDLQDIGDIIGTQLNQALTERGIIAKLQSVVTLGNQVTAIVTLMSAITGKTAAINQGKVNLAAKITAINTNMAAFTCPVPDPLAADPKGCTAMKLAFTAIPTDVTPFDLSGLIAQLKTVQDVQNQNLSSLAQNGINQMTSGSISASVTLQTASVSQQIKDSFTQFQANELASYLVPFHFMTENIIQMMQGFREDAKNFTSLPLHYGPEISGVGIALACWFGMIIVLTMAGALIGELRYKKEQFPTERHGLVVTGGFCLMTAVYLMFMFAWLKMILTVALMILGTQTHASVCPILQSESSNFTPINDALTAFSQSLVIHNFIPLDVADVLSKCMNDESIYSALNMGLLFNISALQAQLDNLPIMSKTSQFKVVLPYTNILSAPTEAQVNAAIQPGILDISGYANVLSGVNISTTLVATFARQLDTVVAAYNGLPSAPFFIPLTAIADSARSIDHVNGPTLTAMKNDLSAVVQSLQQTLQGFGPKVTAALQNAKDVQTFFSAAPGTPKTSLTATVADVVNSFTLRLTGYIQLYVSHIVHSLEADVGHCKPAYNAYQGLATLVCNGVIEPVNGLWFSLGLILVLFVPLIFLNTRLAKYYSRAQGLKITPTSTSPADTEIQITIPNLDVNGKPILTNGEKLVTRLKSFSIPAGQDGKVIPRDGDRRPKAAAKLMKRLKSFSRPSPLDADKTPQGSVGSNLITKLKSFSKPAEPEGTVIVPLNADTPKGSTPSQMLTVLEKPSTTMPAKPEDVNRNASKTILDTDNTNTTPEQNP